MAKVHFSLNVNKVLTAYKNYDLFKRGFYSLNYSENDTLNMVKIPRSVLTTSSGSSFPRWIDPEEWGSPMGCGYYGRGPLDLQDFILTNGSYKNSDLGDQIKSNNVVMYDFNSNELVAYNTTSTFDYYPFRIMAKDDGKIVFLLEFSDPYSGQEQAISDIQKTIHFATSIFGTDLQVITYIGNTNSELYYYHSFRSPTHAFRRKYYNLILDFDSFEIWIEYPFSLKQKNIQFDDSFRQFLRALNYPVLNKKFDNVVLQSLDRITKKDQQTNQAIWITYGENYS